MARILSPPVPSFPALEPPIRGELFGVERLEQFAESLAASHQVLRGRRRGRPILPRLAENGRVLLVSYREIARAIREERSITPAAEWLVDNFHIVDEQVREVREDLPPGYYRELPKLADGPLKGYPRVYGIAWAFVEHTDSLFDPETLARFVRAYQRVRPLTIGELWAIAISLRLVLIENLRRIADRIVRRRTDREEADAFADALLDEANRSPAAAREALERLEGALLTDSFAVQLVARLRDYDPQAMPALALLNERLSREGTTPDEIVRREQQTQVATHVTVRNVITSMRLMSSTDWEDFFEGVSLVEAALREGTRVAEMDFATRDRYRHAVEELARSSSLSELEVARKAAERARQARGRSRSAPEPAGGRLADPGYYLISRGRPAFEKEIGFRVPVRQWLRRAYVSAATPGYLGTVAALSALLLSVPLAAAAKAGAGTGELLVLALLALIPASELAIALVNRDVTELVGPRRLPKIELPDGPPEELRTLVVVPTMLTTEAEVREQVERLEVHYLANSAGHFHFALLSDWADADFESAPEDEALLALAREQIVELNARHSPAPGGQDRFLLFHRRRLFNPAEGKWMGWERKRGKLHELNRLLRGAEDTTFLPGSRVPAGVRYVITLDADTQLPRGAASRLVGAMAHPLQHPVFDTPSGRVVEGHAVLQPRITPTLPATGSGTLFQRIFSGPTGIDPYAFAVSDLYQDLFGEGIYTGKGIYDVDAMERALRNRVPENALLSHDLFEGLFARAGLVSDIELFEGYPAHYGVAAARQHRWARGDWQLLPWLLPRIPTAEGRRARNPIPAIGRWKMLDNLRRSLLAPTSLALLLAAWTLREALPAAWTAFVMGTIALPAFFPVLAEMVPRRRGISKRSFLRGLGSDLLIASAQTVLSVLFLAHQAWLMADAMGRTLVRLTITRRRLLQWVPAAHAQAHLDLELSGFYRRMADSPAIGGAAVLAAAVLYPGSAGYALLFAVLWSLAPAIARWVSLPPRIAEGKPVSPAEERVLRSTARRTWRFFETFVGPEDNHLPPDNFQEDPRPVVAHRTSPTNMGLYLLSTVAAHDLGWIGTVEMVERLEAALGAMRRLERFRGHFFNWYGTLDLRPLEPKYVSTVDSGNLAGHLIALEAACRECLDAPVLGDRALSGLRDAVHVAREVAEACPVDRREGTVSLKQLLHALGEVEALLEPLPASPVTWRERLAELSRRCATLVDTAEALRAERGGEAFEELLDWARAAQACVASHSRDLAVALDWAGAAVPPPRNPGPEEALPEELGRLASFPPTLSDTPERYREVAEAFAAAGAEPATRGLREALTRSAQAAAGLARRLAAISRHAEELFDAMDFSFLFDPARELFSIGYRLADGRLDPGYYDLLASEARLASFVAIARGDVETSHWFRLGRPLTPVGKGSALVSWSGSMFEYLMPQLVLHEPAGSLLHQSARLVVLRQIAFGRESGVPWGVSESAYSGRDLELTYQYSNFGLRGLGLKRGLSEDLVVAPYATALAAMIEPAAAARNFERLARAGARGRYGFYEALDYTGERLSEQTDVVLVRAYMAHHQGMTVVALADVLLSGTMRERFHGDPRVRATELLLQERTPRGVSVARPRAEEVQTHVHVRDYVPPVLRRFQSPHDLVPRTHLLSNGRYVVMLTAAGSGYSRWKDLAVTRWQEDATRDPWGSYVFLRDAQSGEIWSAGYQPSGAEADTYDVAYYEDRVEIHRRDGTIATTLEVVVSAEDDAEIRQVSVTNLGLRAREVELTSYAEVVLAPPASDLAHPAFAKLFVQTQFVPGLEALLATRRPRLEKDARVWAAHVASVEGAPVGTVQYETDRARFLGRGRSLPTASSILDGRPLSNTVGSVLDPIFSLRRRVRIAPGSTARVTFSTILAGSREQALVLADKYRGATIFGRTATLAWTQAQVQLSHLGIGADEAHLFQRVATRILYADPSLRPSPEVLQRCEQGPSALWRHGISGDVPIVLVRIDDVEDRDIVRQLLLAHEYWRMKGLVVDLVIVNEQGHSYGQELQASLESLARAAGAAPVETAPGRGGVFILRGDLLSREERDALAAAARAQLLSRQGSLSEQVVRLLRAQPTPVPAPKPTPPAKPTSEIPPPRPALEFFNGLGGFDAEGREYVVVLGEGQWTPAPWVNVVSNASFGFQVSESGAGFTWSENSRLNQLTPWSNDPVCDPPGEAILVRDEETGELWGPTALPIREEWPYVARHGAGYSRFEHESHGIALDLLQFVPRTDPVKISRLTIENHSGRARRLSITAYVEWVLGASRAASAPYVVTSLEPETGAIFARNCWNEEFPGRVAFADLGGRQEAWTSDRTEFLGRNGSLDRPAALAPGETLSGRVGAGLDPCGALQTTVELSPGRRAEVLFLLGEADSAEEAKELVRRYRRANLDALLEEVERMWDDILGALQIRTPDRSMDILVNRWLLYQTLACRVWARSAFYQAGGAYGFRDQLQDSMALTVARREITREQILRSAARQFTEGDVQHWWHPPSGIGVRTRMSDDRLWLPYALVHYLEVTGDRAILDAPIPFLAGPPLAEGEHEKYFLPSVSPETATLFEHCARALDRSLAVGAHGLPLMGTGDWNDGMNRVGHLGRGESVWLGWFLHTVLWEFARIAEARGEKERAQAWREHVSKIEIALERDGWDGDWYRRAFFDDGTPIGSAQNAECRIDSIAQSWGVLSGAAERGRAVRAMAALEEYLVRRGDGLVLLFTPPFDKTPLDPGYIKGYVPGVRENGGQYTHAAIWAVCAFAALGDGDKAGELFSILNPINHASTRAGLYRYKVEPYVAAADIYAEIPHVGRGGWTWYTGSAGWMYRAAVEWILGFRLRELSLHLDPCIPRAWPGYEISFRYHSSRYELEVRNPYGVTRGVSRVELDGEPVEGGAREIPLSNDGKTHRIVVVLG